MDWQTRDQVRQEVDNTLRGMKNLEDIGTAGRGLMNQGWRAWILQLTLLPLLVGIIMGVLAGLVTGAQTGTAVGVVFGGLIDLILLPVFAFWLVKQLFTAIFG